MNNISERGAKAAKRHQAVSGYWHNQRTLARWCRTRSYLDSAAAHGLTALDAITAALGVARQTILHKVQRGELAAVHVRRGRRSGLRIQVKPGQTGPFENP